MTTHHTRLPHRRIRHAVAGLLLAGSLAVGVGAAPASADTGRDEHPILAMGDSIVYGYNPNLVATRDYTHMTGYPEILADHGEHLLANLACPGQSAQAMLSLTAPDYACFHGFLAGGGQLHWPYTGTQIDAAKAFLTAHPDTRLVTIGAGGNDFALCFALPSTLKQACLANFAAAVTTALTETVHQLRAAGYHRPIVLTGYYPFPPGLDTFDPLLLTVQHIQQQVANATGARYADTWNAFVDAARPYNGDTCAAGLVIKLPNGTCDLHPTHKGSQLLADAVTRALKHRHSD